MYLRHGLRYTPEYPLWLTMKQRCLNPKNRDYADYGGRGITICQAWQDSFQAFYADMGPRPSSRHMLERRDNDGPYNPENTYWATAQVQARNKRTTHWITINGHKASLAEWLVMTGHVPSTVKRRVKRGMTWEQALMLPPDPKKQHPSPRKQAL